jgi:prepilin-type N-terminal cleavage/methylation domain-containing protein
MQQNTNRKGFTLIELLIVVVIIGILAAIAIPKFSSTKEKAYVATMKADLKNLVNVEEAFYADSNKYATGASLTGKYAYTTSQGNVMAAGDIDGAATGWSAQVTNPAVTSIQTGTIFAGDPNGGGMTKKGNATNDGAPFCQ